MKCHSFSFALNSFRAKLCPWIEKRVSELGERGMQKCEQKCFLLDFYLYVIVHGVSIIRKI